CLDHRRKHRWWRRVVAPARSEDESESPLLERLPAPAEDPLEELGRGRVMSQLWAAVEGLSHQQRAALLLQVQEGLRTAEIAQVLKCSEATVRVHLHRALTTLRRTLGGT
ncbi:MAG: sigma-70 family RNA polymerase sigma factor, partial [Candidatus Rokubacteria bacterium]|nr:sigma-70 family RNA polymerase sigma factor [Candidatus Rokubacteria bacterium]